MVEIILVEETEEEKIKIPISNIPYKENLGLLFSLMANNHGLNLSIVSKKGETDSKTKENEAHIRKIQLEQSVNRKEKKIVDLQGEIKEEKKELSETMKDSAIADHFFVLP